jgi:hypothetical protein
MASSGKVDLLPPRAPNEAARWSDGGPEPTAAGSRQAIAAVHQRSVKRESPRLQQECRAEVEGGQQRHGVERPDARHEKEARGQRPNDRPERVAGREPADPGSHALDPSRHDLPRKREGNPEQQGRWEHDQDRRRGQLR